MDSCRTSDNSFHRSVPPCYPSTLNDTSLPEKFRDLDDSDDFSECRQRLLDENTENFIVDYGSDEAWCAFDIDSSEFTALLESAPKPFETRWINIWAPERQKETIKAITAHYGISTRLRAMMASDPYVATKPPPSPAKPASKWPSTQGERGAESEKSPFANINEVESGTCPDSQHTPPSAPTQLETSGLSSLSFGHLINQIWHFFSVDFGERYMCIGYNSVYAISGIDFGNASNFPKGKRVWAWLVLCDDGTVISIQENPFPPSTSFAPEARLNSLAVIRRNVSSIFSNVSKQHRGFENANTLMTTQVRNFSDSSATASVKAGECSGLLFYDIFDDWMGTYNLIIKRKSSYSKALETLRESVLVQAQVKLINELHLLGQQLAVLKHIYQSYELILNRILKRQRRLRDENRNNVQGLQSLQCPTEKGRDTWRMVTYDDGDPTTLGGVKLSSAALGRFERLIDRIGLYALSEIDQCLSEKEALTLLVFNLIAMKDSQAVEKLTRITILLAKLTIVFLPVSLVTAYFSTEIEELQNYTAKTYWVTFAVVMFLSVVVLYLFGALSGTIESRPVHRAAQKFYDSSLRALGRRKQRRSAESGE